MYIRSNPAVVLTSQDFFIKLVYFNEKLLLSGEFLVFDN